MTRLGKVVRELEASMLAVEGNGFKVYTSMTGRKLRFEIGWMGL